MLTIGRVSVLRSEPSAPNMAEQQDGLDYDLWVDTALTMGPTSQLGYSLNTTMPRGHADSEFASVNATRYTGGGTSVPKDMDSLAADHTLTACPDLEKTRAIE